MISRIDHVSIAVKDYEKARKFFCNILGAIPGAGEKEDNMKYHWQLFSLGDLTRLELLNPTGEGSFLDNFLRTKEGGVHHITLETPDIEAAKQKMAENNIPIFGEHAYEGDIWKEFFIHPRHAFGVLIQIAEFNPNDFLASSVKLPDNRKWLIKKTKSGCTLTIAQKGGGTTELDLTGEQMQKLAKEIGENL